MKDVNNDCPAILYTKGQKIMCTRNHFNIRNVKISIFSFLKFESLSSKNQLSYVYGD